MFNLFKSKNEENNPDWLPELQETQERWNVFLGKLEDKMQELCEAAVPELTDLFNGGDDDFHKSTFHRMYAGVSGQLENIRKKAYDAYDEKILGLYDDLKSELSVSSPHYSLVNDFRNKCSDRYHKKFSEKLNYWQAQLENTKLEDFELKYQSILAEYEKVKNGFTCKQCGGGLTIEKIFFISTFITCPSCQTQNTFEPSSQARGLQMLAPNLAEQRVANLIADYSYQVSLERELYFERHQLSLSTTFEKDKKLKAEKEQQIIDLTAQRQSAIDKAPELYKIYLRAKYDEINKILPDLKEHNEVRYQNEANSYRSPFS